MRCRFFRMHRASVEYLAESGYFTVAHFDHRDELEINTMRRAIDFTPTRADDLGFVSTFEMTVTRRSRWQDTDFSVNILR